MIEIRYAHINDAKALGEIHSLSWKEAYKGIVSEKVMEEFSPEARTERFNITSHVVRRDREEEYRTAVCERRLE
jgi:hypothetical protein